MGGGSGLSHFHHHNQTSIRRIYIMLYGYMINFKNFSRKTIFNKFPMTRNQAVEALDRAILYYKTEYPQAQIDSTLVIKRKY